MFGVLGDVHSVYFLFLFFVFDGHLFNQLAQEWTGRHAGAILGFAYRDIPPLGGLFQKPVEHELAVTRPEAKENRDTGC